MKSAQTVLKDTFGFHEFRGHQQEIIEHLLAGGDALVLMPTGGGKSLCYQIPSILREGVGIVISPLIALMQDQVRALQEVGVRAEALNSSLTFRDALAIEKRFVDGDLDVLYVAPERLMTPRFLELIGKAQVALFAIDEAHCVSQWGHDFRKDYLQLSILHETFPNVPRIAMTATADDPTRREIILRLGLENAKTFIAGFDRPNIRYRVVLKQRAREQLLRFIESEHRGDAGIVYCLSRNKVEETSQWLSAQGLTALPYHAGLDTRTRAENQDRFIREEGIIIVATVAFGMGIDKPNVRFVAHLDLPKSIEAYYQETGRAGRDGLSAQAWMAYSLADVVALRQMLETSEANEEFKRIEHRRLNALLGYCETTACRRKVLIQYFGETIGERCNNCDTCLEPVDTWDGSEAARKALSAVYRTGQRFGAAYVIDVLLGKENERNVRFRHNRLSVFGVGKELSEQEWSSVFRQLVAGGYLTVDMTGYGGLSLSEASRSVLQGENSLRFRRDLPRSKSKRTQARDSTKQPLVANELFHALRAHRMKLAKSAGLPPYVIFHDSTLSEMAQVEPKTLIEMRSITGVGDAKLSKYGDSFLRVILDWRSNRSSPAISSLDMPG